MFFFGFSIFWGAGAEEGSPSLYFSHSNVQMGKLIHRSQESTISGKNRSIVGRDSDLKLNCAFAVSLKLHCRSSSTTCCCRQINSQLLVSDWENQIWRKRRGKKISFPLTFLLFCVGFFGQLANILHFRLFCEINKQYKPHCRLLIHCI